MPHWLQERSTTLLVRMVRLPVLQPWTVCPQMTVVIIIHHSICFVLLCRCWSSDILVKSELYECSLLSLPTGYLWRHRQEGVYTMHLHNCTALFEVFSGGGGGGLVVSACFATFGYLGAFVPSVYQPGACSAQPAGRMITLRFRVYSYLSHKPFTNQYSYTVLMRNSLFSLSP